MLNNNDINNNNNKHYYLIQWINENPSVILANVNALPNKQSDLLMQQPKHINVNVSPHNVARVLMVRGQREVLTVLAYDPCETAQL